MNPKNFYRKLLVLAIPVALQNLITVGVSMVDTVMLGSLGEVTLSASSLANQLFFIFTLVIYGTAGGSNVLVAQFWGKKDVTSIKKVMAYSYRVMLAFACIMVLCATLIPEQVMGLFSTDIRVVEEGVMYLRIVSISYVFFGIATITTNILRAVHTVNISLFASILSLLVNVIFNWILIFGKFGFPALGIRGAAIATTLARMIECLVVVIYLRFHEKKLHVRFKELLHLDAMLAKRFASNCGPVVCNELLWSCGTALLSVIIGRIGTQFTAAYSIYNVISQLACVMSQGLAAAAAVMVGNAIGAKREGAMDDIVKYLQHASYVVGVFAFLLVFALRPFMPYIYDISNTALEYLMQILWIGAIMEAFRPMAFVNMVGILRGGGDAKFVLINDILFLWTICLPCGYLCGLVFHMPIPIVFTILRFDDLIKVVTSTIRIRHHHWIKHVTD